jgi:GT2 family glycosyltransferase
MSTKPDLQLIYSDQQFFGESQWLRSVPNFSSSATKSGPLPVMSLYLRSLFEDVGGYSSSLPWGNEDYDFWLKLVEHGVRHQKLEGAHVFYRYKSSSMMRDSMDFTQDSS